MSQAPIQLCPIMHCSLSLMSATAQAMAKPASQSATPMQAANYCTDKMALLSPDMSPGSPYNHQAYCEQFPRNSSVWGDAVAARAAETSALPGTYQYWAQVGKAEVPGSNFDNIGWALLTVFQVST